MFVHLFIQWDLIKCWLEGQSSRAREGGNAKGLWILCAPHLCSHCLGFRPSRLGTSCQQTGLRGCTACPWTQASATLTPSLEIIVLMGARGISWFLCASPRLSLLMFWLHLGRKALSCNRHHNLGKGKRTRAPAGKTQGLWEVAERSWGYKEPLSRNREMGSCGLPLGILVNCPLCTTLKSWAPGKIWPKTRQNCTKVHKVIQPLLFRFGSPFSVLWVIGSGIRLLGLHLSPLLLSV